MCVRIVGTSVYGMAATACPCTSTYVGCAAFSEQLAAAAAAAVYEYFLLLPIAIVLSVFCSCKSNIFETMEQRGLWVRAIF